MNKEEGRAIALLDRHAYRGRWLYSRPCATEHRLLACGADGHLACRFAHTMAGSLPAPPPRWLGSMAPLNADNLNGRPTFRFAMHREMLRNL